MLLLPNDGDFLEPKDLGRNYFSLLKLGWVYHLRYPLFPLPLELFVTSVCESGANSDILPTRDVFIFSLV